jgi:hypothetical protein
MLRLFRGSPSVGMQSVFRIIDWICYHARGFTRVPGRVLAASTRDGETDDDTLVRTVLLGASLRLSTKMQ